MKGRSRGLRALRAVLLLLAAVVLHPGTTLGYSLSAKKATPTCAAPQSEEAGNATDAYRRCEGHTSPLPFSTSLPEPNPGGPDDSKDEREKETKADDDFKGLCSARREHWSRRTTALAKCCVHLHHLSGHAARYILFHCWKIHLC